MAISRPALRPTTIDIDGPDGNAYALMGYATRYSKQLGLPTATILEEMRSGDYINLLRTFEKYFGEFVALETTNETYLEAFGNDGA